MPTIETVETTNWFPAFKAGTHTDSGGATRAWTESDIDAIIAANAGLSGRVPAVLGHPKTDDPAYGWLGGIKKVVCDGVPHIYMRLRDVVGEFADQVNAGMYKFVSIALRPDMTLKHVGFLGATPPAVKGLAPVAFAADDAATIYAMEFSEIERSWLTVNLFRRMLRAMRGTRDLLVEQYGVERVDKAIDPGMLEYMGDDIGSLENDPDESGAAITAYSQQDEGGTMSGENADLIKKVEELTTRVSAFAEDEQKLRDENAALTARLAAMDAATRRKECELFCEGLVADGRMTPAQRDMAVPILESLAGAGASAFAEGTETGVERLKKLLGTLPKAALFGEYATAGRAAKPVGAGGAGDKLDAETRRIMREQTIDYAAAFSEAQRANPDLALAVSTSIESGRRAG